MLCSLPPCDTPLHIGVHLELHQQSLHLLLQSEVHPEPRSSVGQHCIPCSQRLPLRSCCTALLIIDWICPSVKSFNQDHLGSLLSHSREYDPSSFCLTFRLSILFLLGEFLNHFSIQDFFLCVVFWMFLVNFNYSFCCFSV